VKSNDLGRLWGPVFGGDGSSELVMKPLWFENDSCQDEPRCIAWEALIGMLGSLLTGDDPAVRLVRGCLALVPFVKGVVAGVMGK